MLPKTYKIIYFVPHCSSRVVLLGCALLQGLTWFSVTQTGCRWLKTYIEQKKFMPYGPGYCINRPLSSKAARIFRRYWSFLDLVFPAHIWCFRQECTSIHRRFRRRSLPQHGIFRWQTCVFPFGLPSQSPTFPLSQHNLFPHHTGHFRSLHWILVYKRDYF